MLLLTINAIHFNIYICEITLQHLDTIEVLFGYFYFAMLIGPNCFPAL